MFSRTGAMLGVALLCAGAVRADFTYEETAKITGGAMAGAMKVVGVFSKTVREPMKSTVSVKGNQMVRTTAESTTITDLDKETVTTINHRNKTYSVVTFQQMMDAMKKAAADARARQQQANDADKPEVAVNLSVKDTGQSKVIQGLNTQEKVLTFEMETTDTRTGKKGTMVMTSDMWMAPDIPGYEEVRQFHKKQAEKMGMVMGAGAMGMMGAQPEMSKAMAKMAQEGSKLNGVPVLQVVSMTAKGDPEQMAAMQQQQAQGQQQQQQRQQQPSQSAGEAATGAIAGRLGKLGGFGGLGRRKKEQPQQQQEQTPPPAEQQQAPAQNAAPGALMEMTTEMGSFSSGPVDGSKFTVPSGYKQVENETEKYLRK